MVAGAVETKYTSSASQEAAAQLQAAELRTTELTAQLSVNESPALKTELAALNASKAGYRQAQLNGMNWEMIWGIPAIMAVIVLVLFAPIFKEPQEVIKEA